jgi:hypothetical protein
MGKLSSAGRVFILFFSFSLKVFLFLDLARLLWQRSGVDDLA